MRTALLIGTAISALTAASAFAADLPTKKAPPAPIVVVPFTWTGCYVGAEGGFGWGKEKDNFDYPLYYLSEPPVSVSSAGALTNSVTTFSSSSGDPLIGTSIGGGGFNASGGKIGGRAGCNYQVNQFVFGGVVDFEWSGIRGTKTTTWNNNVTTYGVEGVSTTSSQPGYTHLSLQNDWQGSIRGNVGWAFDRLLIYATGGAAFAEIKSSWSVSDPCAGAYLGSDPYSCNFYQSSNGSSGPFNTGWWGGSQSKTVWGWTVGGGVEYAIDNHWSILGEVRYVSFEHVNVALPLSFYQTRVGVGSGGEFGVFGYNASFNEILAQVGVDYRF